ncbi:MAG: hypothetical protein ACRDFB_05420 [Rhabdochlamydiaceae bacterium]
MKPFRDCFSAIRWIKRNAAGDVAVIVGRGRNQRIDIFGWIGKRTKIFYKVETVLKG